MRRKIIFISLVILLALILSIPLVFADMNDVENQLDESVTEELSNLDLSQLNDIVDNLGEDERALFKSSTFLDKVRALLDGENIDYSSFLSTIIHTFFDGIVKCLPLIISIIVISILCSIVSSLRSKVGEASVEKIINFVCFITIVFMLFGAIINLSTSVSECILNLKGQMDATFPIMLTLIASVGGVNSVGVFQPMLAICSNLVVQVFSYFLLPLFGLIVVFCIIGQISDVKFDKIFSLFKSIFRWTSKGMFWAVSGVVVVGGAMAGAIDNVSIKATRFAIKSSVPMVGGYISDGISLVAVSGVLIKNAVGIGGVVLAIGSIIFPIVSVLVFALGLKFAGSILQLASNNEIADFLFSLAKVVELLITILAGVGFMYLISLGILINTVNIL